MESLIGLLILLILFVLGGALSGFIAYSRVKKLENKVASLQQQIRSFDSLKKREESVQPEITRIYAATTNKQPRTKEVPEKEKEAPGKKTSIGDKEHEQDRTKETEQIIPAETLKKKQSTGIMKKFETQFMENWTGIIGAVITVIGIAFLGVFTALNLSEMYCFFMIVLISVILLILYFILRTRKKWLKLSLWLRSMSAALFLLACAGAGGIPGLRWIDNPLQGLTILCLGIGANILLAIVGKKEVIASVHLLLSLTALAIAPQNQVIFIIATVITFSGILLTLREKWEFHLLLSTTLYCAYFLFYYFTLGVLSTEMKIIGIISISGISIISLFVHYRKLYKHPGFDLKPFLTHILTWIYFGIGIFTYSPRVYWISIPLGAAALLCFIFAHRARSLKIRWLFNTDILMAQVIAVIAVVTLVEWNIPSYPIISILFIETMVFLIIVLIEEEYILYTIGNFYFYFFALLLIIFSFINSQDHTSGNYVPNTLLFSLCILVTFLYHITAGYIVNKRILNNKIAESDKKWCNAQMILCGALLGFFFIPLYFTLRGRLPFAPYIDAEYLLLIPLGIIIFTREKIQSNGLGISLLFTILIIHTTMWQDPFFTSTTVWYEKLLYVLPLFIIDACCIWFTRVTSPEKHIKWPGIYLGAAHLFFVTYVIFDPISPLLPGVAWLILSVVFLELSRLMTHLYGDALPQKGSPDAHVLNLGYLFIGAFLIRHILVHLQSSHYILIVKARVLIELFAIIIFLYWAFFKKPAIRKERKSFTYLHPLFPELIILFMILTIAVEIENTYLPIVWILGSAAALFIGTISKQHLSRFRFYSLLLYWASIIHMAFLTSPMVSPLLRFFHQTWFLSLIAIMFQFGYILFFYKKGAMATITFPKPLTLPGNKRLIHILEPRKNLWIFYPYFFSIALFLIRLFDESILTLLLSAECFLIFVISIILKENHFRYASLAGLGICMIRLVFYDLASSNILTKAVVCIGVGLLLIGMNTLYNKFSNRFKK
ncbi:MAG: DUF2339 domain-containing protein [Spirochaetales bacterium]|nr:DUF2339 domain-containing protein [Spirochaetales bacterium]